MVTAVLREDAQHHIGLTSKKFSHSLTLQLIVLRESTHLNAVAYISNKDRDVRNNSGFIHLGSFDDERNEP